MPASKTYEQFCRDLEASRAAVNAVAIFLQGCGCEVILPPHNVTPSEEQRYAYTDAGDLRITRTYQIKQSSRTFTSVEEFGFPMITVDEEYKIEAQQQNPPLGYWIVSKCRTGAIYIPWNTRDSWDVYETVDPLQGGRACRFVRCPAGLCMYRAF